MTVFKVKLDTAQNVALFVTVCMHYDCDIICTSGSLDGDCKSLIGMMNFIGKNTEVCFNCDDERVVELFRDEIKLWIAEQERQTCGLFYMIFKK